MLWLTLQKSALAGNRAQAEDELLRLRECVPDGVEVSGGSRCPAVGWMPTSGHAKKLTNVHVTADRTPVPAVVLVHQKGMKGPWCLATSLGSASARQVVDLYSRI